MRDNLQVYHTILTHVCQWFPTERITRLRNFSLFLSGLYLSAAVQLPKIVRKWPFASQHLSLVNRLRRFLDNSALDIRTYYRPIAAGLAQTFAGQPIRLIIDYTKLGFHYRLVTVSIAYRKRALPLAWSVHRGSKGHIPLKAQQALLAYIAGLLPASSPVWLIGDSGFHSVALIRWLRRRHWHLVLRQPGHLKVSSPSLGPWVKLTQRPLQPGETRALGWVRLTECHDYGWLWLVLHWQVGEDDPWYLVSDHPDTRGTIQRYRLRMWTEELYGDLKGHGLNLEATHLQDVQRLERLVLGVCYVFVWLMTLGSWVVKRGFRSLVDRHERRDKSYFRIGWDWIERCLSLGSPLELRFLPS